ncbi:MAG: T9SS type A sorting domain-containing protein, partial [Candidatus Diapherotrites archaeon]
FEQTYDSSFSYFPTDQNNRGGKVTNKPIVIEENLLIPKYTFKYMEPYNEDYSIKGSKSYSVIIWAESERGLISDAIRAYFAAEPYASLSFKSIISNIFPNPALSSTRISLQQEGDISITAVDILGRAYPLWSGYATPGEKELDVSSLPAGSYNLLINYGSKIETVRMIKE